MVVCGKGSICFQYAPTPTRRLDQDIARASFENGNAHKSLSFPRPDASDSVPHNLMFR